MQNRLSSRLLSRKLKIKIYRTIILPVVLYGREAWSLTLREERKLRVFENMVLRRLFGPMCKCKLIDGLFLYLCYYNHNSKSRPDLNLIWFDLTWHITTTCLYIHRKVEML